MWCVSISYLAMKYVSGYYIYSILSLHRTINVMYDLRWSLAGASLFVVRSVDGLDFNTDINF